MRYIRRRGRRLIYTNLISMKRDQFEEKPMRRCGFSFMGYNSVSRQPRYLHFNFNGIVNKNNKVLLYKVMTQHHKELRFV